MLDAIVAGETDPAKLAALAQGTPRSKNAELREALRGRVTEHHRTLLKPHLQMWTRWTARWPSSMRPGEKRWRNGFADEYDVERKIADAG
jgi:hypothetical protein